MASVDAIGSRTSEELTAPWRCRYDLGLIGGAILSIHDELHTSQTMEEFVVGSAKLGAVLGTFLGGGLMVCYGRRATIAMDSFFFVLGPITMAFSSSLLYVWA